MKTVSVSETLIVSCDEYTNRKDELNLEWHGFVIENGELRAPLTKEKQEWLIAKNIPYEVEVEFKEVEMKTVSKWMVMFLEWWYQKRWTSNPEWQRARAEVGSFERWRNR